MHDPKPRNTVHSLSLDVKKFCVVPCVTDKDLLSLWWVDFAWPPDAYKAALTTPPEWDNGEKTGLKAHGLR